MTVRTADGTWVVPRIVHRVAKLILDDPSNRQTLAGLCKAPGTSKPTVERLFQEDIGMRFSKWRQQLRLMNGEFRFYRATTFSIFARKSPYGSAPGWYMATFPARSSSTSVGVVEAP